MIQDSTETGRMTVGLDVSDRYTQCCVLDAAGPIVEVSRVATTPGAMGQSFGRRPRARVVAETGTHSPWMSRVAHDAGHEVIVANPRRVQLIAKNDNKGDRIDAELLARLGRVDPQLLAPMTHRGPAAQRDLAMLWARDALVRVRTRMVNHVRAQSTDAGRVNHC